MRLRPLFAIGLALAAAALLPACSRSRPAPKQADTSSQAASATVGSKLDTASMDPQDRMYVEGFLRGSNTADGKRSYEATALPSEAAARQVFPGAKFPTYGPGERVAIIWLTALNPSQDPRASLAAIYRGGLIVYESRFERGVPQRPEGETVEIAPGVQGVVVTPQTKLPSEKSVLEVVWKEGNVTYLVRGAGSGVTKDEVIKVAKSMK